MKFMLWKKYWKRILLFSSDDVDVDVFGMAYDELSVCIVLFHIRAGRIRAVKTWVGERIDDSDEKAIVIYVFDPNL